MTEDGKKDLVLGGAVGGQPRLGPWFVTSRIQQPQAPRALTKSRKEMESNPDSSEPNSPPFCPGSLRPYPSLPRSPPDSNRRQKPSKVTCRWNGPGILLWGESNCVV